MAAPIEEFSYQLTAEALGEQERALAALRTRGGTVLAAASISGSFLGTKVSHSSLDIWAVLALIVFVASVGAAIYVLFPHKLVFVFRGQALLAASDHEGIDDVTEAYAASRVRAPGETRRTLRGTQQVAALGEESEAESDRAPEKDLVKHGAEAELGSLEQPPRVPVACVVYAW